MFSLEWYLLNSCLHFYRRYPTCRRCRSFRLSWTENWRRSCCSLWFSSKNKVSWWKRENLSITRKWILLWEKYWSCSFLWYCHSEREKFSLQGREKIRLCQKYNCWSHITKAFLSCFWHKSKWSSILQRKTWKCKSRTLSWIIQRSFWKTQSYWQ